jgi:hypothetical protein
MCLHDHYLSPRKEASAKDSKKRLKGDFKKPDFVPLIYLHASLATSENQAAA